MIHVQEVSRVLALAENVLAGHVKQVVLFVACNVVEYVLTAQSRHDVFPGTSLYVPDAQGVQL
jgi:hypothetical protein